MMPAKNEVIGLIRKMWKLHVSNEKIEDDEIRRAMKSTTFTVDDEIDGNTF